MAITIDGADNKLEIGANATGPSSLRLYEDTDNGTNYVSIIAPSAVTSNRTITLPDATGTVQVSGNAISGTTGSFSSDLSFNSGYGSAAVAFGCRAWVDFDGTGTPAIRGSGNVSSITDNTTGSYTVNFTTAMPDVNFAVTGSAGSKDNDGVDNGVVCLFNRTTSSASIFTRNVQSSGGTTDYDAVNVAIFR